MAPLRRHGAQASTSAATAARVMPTCVGSPSQAHVCCGPQLNADDSAVVSTPTAMTLTAMIIRRRELRVTQNASRQGIKTPSMTHTISAPGASAASTGGRTGSQSRKGVPASCCRTASSTRSRTCPKPKGTAAGNNSANGHVANNTSPPRACSTNQRARKRPQREMAPIRSRAVAAMAPRHVPSVFKARSSLDETRAGR